MLAFIGATAIAFPANAQTNIPALPTPAIDPVIGATVNVLTRMSDNRILVGGDFLRLGSTPANGCGRLLPDGSVDSSFQCTRADAFAQDSSGRIYIIAQNHWQRRARAPAVKRQPRSELHGHQS